MFNKPYEQKKIARYSLQLNYLVSILRSTWVVGFSLEFK